MKNKYEITFKVTNQEFPETQTLSFECDDVWSMEEMIEKFDLGLQLFSFPKNMLESYYGKDLD